MTPARTAIISKDQWRYTGWDLTMGEGWTLHPGVRGQRRAVASVRYFMTYPNYERACEAAAQWVDHGLLTFL